MPKLTTFAEYKKLTPREQGYVSYMQAEWPGSELKTHQRNPYRRHTDDWAEFEAGQLVGMMEAQDSED
jgi:hypothetical protein